MPGKQLETENRFDTNDLIRTSLAYAYVREAVGLLEAAGNLWLGRLGLGRLRRSEHLKTVGEINHRFNGRGDAMLGRVSGELLLDDHSPYFFSSLLKDYSRRSWSRNRAVPIESRNPAASRRLTHAAVHLIVEAQRILEETPEPRPWNSSTREIADRLNDDLETLGESPLYDDPSTPNSPAALRALRERAAYRLLANVAEAAHRAFAWRDPPLTDLEYGDWRAVCGSFRSKARDRYREFAAAENVPAPETGALLLTEESLETYPTCDRHRYGPDALQRTDLHACRLTEAILDFFGLDDPDWRRLHAGEPPADGDTTDDFEVAF